MSQRKLDKSAKFWDKSARKYAKSKIADLAEYENGIAITKQYLDKNQKVLEMGCGTGSTALELAPAVNHITATDISSEMIAIANEKKAAQGISNIDFSVGVATEAQFDNEQFDVVLALNLLHLVSNLDVTLAQAHRILKPGGLFISKTPCLKESVVFSLLKYPLVAAQLFNLAPPVFFLSIEQLEEHIHAAGFETEHAYTNEKSPKRRYIVAKKA
jgi:ubiquinone/menaquinone biosynthesis C-methylase UbiE